MASVRASTPADCRSGCGLNSGIRGGLLKTEDQTRATRRMPPAWASQPVPLERVDVSELSMATSYGVYMGKTRARRRGGGADGSKLSVLFTGHGSRPTDSHIPT